MNCIRCCLTSWMNRSSLPLSRFTSRSYMSHFWLSCSQRARSWAISDTASSSSSSSAAAAAEWVDCLRSSDDTGPCKKALHFTTTTTRVRPIPCRCRIQNTQYYRPQLYRYRAVQILCTQNVILCRVQVYAGHICMRGICGKIWYRLGLKL